jgi:glycosyltransferase involved in cell wall biosynthesis
MSADVSVVIPTRDRPVGLARLLTALRSQSLGTSRFEVIVVDDGSQVPVSVRPEGLRLQIVRCESSGGPAAARNRGWRAASAPTVAFIDDDCRPSPGWLDAIAGAAGAAVARGDIVVLQGRVEPAPEQREDLTPLSHTIQVTAASRLFVSANIAYPRALLAELEGFDERFARAAGEDPELGARALKAGARTQYLPDALVYHEVRAMGLLAHLRHTAKWVDAIRALAIHPELRTLLVARLFWKPTHPWLLAIAAALLTRQPRLAALAAIFYLRHYRAVYEGDMQSLTRALPVHVVIDAGEIATAVAGSIRHRTLML